MIRYTSLLHPSPLLKPPRPRCLTGPRSHIISNTNWTVNKSIEDHAGLRSDYIYHFIPGTFMASYHKDGAGKVASVNYILCHLMCGSDLTLKGQQCSSECWTGEFIGGVCPIIRKFNEKPIIC